MKIAMSGPSQICMSINRCGPSCQTCVTIKLLCYQIYVQLYLCVSSFYVLFSEFLSERFPSESRFPILSFPP